jgi:hypothetical protein
MAQTLYTVTTPAATAVPLVAATAKTVLSIQGATDFGIDLKKFRITFDGVTASAIPVLWELCSHTVATAGTSTAITPSIVAGRQNAVTGFVGAGNFSAEPTVLAAFETEFLTPNGGVLVYDYANFGDTPDSALAQGFALRLTAPAAVNVRATFWFGRC